MLYIFSFKFKKIRLSMIKYFGKAPLCNRIASRGFFIKGFCFPLCCRCSSIIFSMIIFYFIFINLKINYIIGFILSLIFMTPTTIDYMRQFLYKKESNNFRRVITGIFAGIGIALFLCIIRSIYVTK